MNKENIYKALIKKRCILEGCRYGYPHLDEKPLDYCIFCGEPKQEFMPFTYEDLENAMYDKEGRLKISHDPEGF